jgi:hypothetical protein
LLHWLSGMPELLHALAFVAVLCSTSWGGILWGWITQVLCRSVNGLFCSFMFCPAAPQAITISCRPDQSGWPGSRIWTPLKRKDGEGSLQHGGGSLMVNPQGSTISLKQKWVTRAVRKGNAIYVQLIHLFLCFFLFGESLLLLDEERLCFFRFSLCLRRFSSSSANNCCK